MAREILHGVEARFGPDSGIGQEHHRRLDERGREEESSAIPARTDIEDAQLRKRARKH